MGAEVTNLEGYNCLHVTQCNEYGMKSLTLANYNP